MALARLMVAIPPLFLLFALACDGGKEAPPQTSSADLLIGLDYEHEGTANSLLALIDLPTGETLAQIDSGYQTWALLRSSTGELLVSDLAGADFQGRLRVYDIDDLGAPKWSLGMPERAAAIGYGPFWGLSDDERYLYYTVHPRDENGEAQQLANVVGIVDLEERREVARAGMPGFCPALMPLGGSDVLGLCGDRRSLVSVAPDGSVSTVAGPLAAFTLAPDPSGFWRSPVYGDINPDGDAFMAFGNGDVVFTNADQPPVNLIQSGELRLWGRPAWRLDDDRPLFAVGPAYPDDSSGYLLDHVIAFDRADPVDSSQCRLPAGTTDLAPLGGDRLALLEPATEAIHLFDMSNCEVTEELEAPPGTNWLIAQLVAEGRR